MIKIEDKIKIIKGWFKGSEGYIIGISIGNEIGSEKIIKEYEVILYKSNNKFVKSKKLVNTVSVYFQEEDLENI